MEGRSTSPKRGRAPLPEKEEGEEEEGT